LSEQELGSPAHFHHEAVLGWYCGALFRCGASIGVSESEMWVVGADLFTHPKIKFC
jgi:hypothetical protein